jgi:hypothetical protein
MARYGKRQSMNFGFGRCIKHAAVNILRQHFMSGHFATVAAHSQRWSIFSNWLRTEHNVLDARSITNEIILKYTSHLTQLVMDNKIAASTATNRVSTVNVVLAIMRGDDKVRIDKISEALGFRRSHIRRTHPDGIYLMAVEELHAGLILAGFSRVAAIVGLARSTGMRLREAILADLPRLRSESEKYALINIQDGTKGGRGGAHAPRWVPVTKAVRDAIEFALDMSPVGSRNLLAIDETYIGFINRVVKPSRKIIHQYRFRGFHELRAAYACERYQQLVGRPAPLISHAGGRASSDKVRVRHARQTISRELGHERIDVTNAYLGSESR